MATEQDTGQDADVQQHDEQQQDSGDNPERAGQLAEKPDVDESAKEKAKEMRKAYQDDVQTAVLPGSDRTVTGTAVNEWLDDEGNPKFGKEKQKSESKSDENAESKSDENAN